MNSLLDLRIPIGLLLSLYGLTLTGWGLISDSSIYQRSLGINVNLWWGIFLAFIGVLFLIVSRKGINK